MRAVQCVFPCVAGLLMLGVASAAPAPGEKAAGDPLLALLRDPDAKALYLAAVSASCGTGGGTGQFLDYVTGGGYTVKVHAHTITITDPLGRNTVQHWGDPHENLNGKHIKDWGGATGWDGSRRTLLLGDGSKLTMNATGPHGLVLETSIYDGGRELHLSNPTNTVVLHGTDPVGARCREATQHDGETASFSTDAGSGVATYRNAYNEDAAYQRVDSNVPLGTTGGFANPNQVNDLFDDPRLGHT